MKEKAADAHDASGPSNCGPQTPLDADTNERYKRQDFEFAVSLLVSSIGPLSKVFSLDVDGNLEARPGGKLYEGMVTTQRFPSIGELAATISEMTPYMALAYGLPAHANARIVRQHDLEAARAKSRTLPVVARTREAFTYPKGPAILMVDHDAPKDGTAALDREAFRAAIYPAVPGLEAAPHLLAHSASTFIYRKDTETCLRGAGGLRLLVVVQDGEDIPRAGRVLFERLLLAGCGRAEITRAGTVLVKTLIDGTVWQPERLDFMGGAACQPPLEQRRPAPLALNADTPPLDTRTALPSLTSAEAMDLERIEAVLKREAEPRARETRKTWASARARDVTGESEGEAFEAARRLYTKAAQDHLLLGDFELVLDGGERVTVGRVLDNPSKYHGRRCADPLEPSYGNDGRIGYVDLRRKGPPRIWSHAHGGRAFRLCRALETIKVQAGERVMAVERVRELLREFGDVYQRGGDLVQVDARGRVQVLDLQRFLLLLDAQVRWTKYSERKKADVPADAPRSVAEGFLASVGDSGLPELKGLLTAPAMDPITGVVIVQEGYHASASVVLALPPEAPAVTIPNKPTFEDVKLALGRLWFPFSEFPLCGPVDRGVLLAAILSAVERPLLETCPGFAFDAPVAGSGKTLLGRCLAALAGVELAVEPASAEDVETQKRLLAHGLEGSTVVCFDNLSGAFGSDSLCSWLTSPVFKGRVLRESRNAAVPTRMLVVLTGNNLRMKGDLCRRVLTCRIDPQTETPWCRAFTLDPLKYIRNNRQRLVADTLEVLRLLLRARALDAGPDRIFRSLVRRDPACGPARRARWPSGRG